jgi:uncharacterized protein YdeI (BOF family)
MIRIPFGSVGLAVAAALFAAGCSESTGPDGAPTDLTVRVYVDADGSGTFNAGDAPVAGATVTASSQDGTSAQATTDAQGAATLAGLEPGTYTLSLGGNAPAGAVLSTASEPLFTASSQGGPGTAEFRFSYFPGSLNGVLYRDENGNNVFDAATDLPAPSIPVELYAGATVAGEPLATTTTSAAGAFAFAGLRPGRYTIRFVSPDGITVVGGASQAVTVTASAPTVLPVRFTGNLRIPIAQARTRAINSPVTVEGVVTAGRGQLGARNFYVQDNTGGIQVFLPSTSTLAVAPGDSVRVSGGIGVFSGAVQISVNPVVEVLGPGTVPAIRSTSGPEVMARTFEGQLVRVDSLTVVSTATTGATSANVNVRTPQGNEFQIRLESVANVPLTTFVVGNTYAVTGVLDNFLSGTTNIPQLKPRGTSDVSDNSPPTIADAKSQPLGTVVTATGVVTAAPGTYNSAYFYIQDRSGGLLVYRFHRNVTLQLGDSVSVTGALRNPFGELQVDTVSRSDSVDVTVIAPGTVPAPRVITGAQLLARTYESSLTRINDVTILTVGSQSSTGSGFNVTARAPDGTEFTIRADGPTNVEAPAFTVGQTYDIVGVLTVFNAVAQIKPRTTDDVIAS